MSNIIPEAWLFIRVKTKDKSGLARFIKAQNKTFDKSVHLLYADKIRVLKDEDSEYWVMVPIILPFLFLIIPLTHVIPKMFAYLAMLASFKLQHKAKGWFLPMGATKIAARAIKQGLL